MYNIAALSEVLKTQYVPLMEEMFKKENRLYDLLSKKGKKGRIDGKELRIALKLTRNPSGGPGGPESAYGDTGISTYGHLLPKTSWYRNRMRVTLEAQDDSRDPAKSYIQALETGLKECLDSFRTMLGQDMYGNRDGAIAVVRAAPGGPGSATLDVRDAYVAQVADEYGSRRALLRGYVNIIKMNAAWAGAVGQRCTFAAAAGGTKLQISAIPNTRQITLSAVVGAAEVKEGDLIVRDAGFNSTAVKGYALYGLDEIIDNGNGVRTALFQDYGGLDRTANPELDSTVITKGGSYTYPVPGPEADTRDPLTTVDLDNVFYQSKHRSGHEATPGNTLMLTHDSVVNSFKGFGASQIVYTPKTAPLGVDTKYLSYNPGMGDFAFAADRMCPPRTIFGVNLEAMDVYENIPIGFDESDGGILKLYRDGSGNVYDIHEAFARTRLQLFSDAPHTHWKVVNIGGTTPEFGASPDSFVFPPA